MDETTIGDQVRGGVTDFFGSTTARDVFSEPATVGDRLVITASATDRAGGFGFGTGTDGQESAGGGGGGGGHASGRPVAVIEVGPHGVEVHPILDLTRIGIAVIATVMGLLRIGRKR